MFARLIHRDKIILLILLVFCAPWLSGCDSVPGKDKPQTVAFSSVDTSATDKTAAALVPAGDYHMVTLRSQPGADTLIMCTEPSPDWATAFGSALAGSLSGGYGGAASGSLSVSDNTSQTISAMLGRTAGVVALRDGLYSACQAYANGVIGRDAYGLIISQYGYLLTQLAAAAASPAGGGSGGAPAAAAAAAPASVSVQVAGAAAPAAAASGAAGGGAAGSAAANAQVAVLQQAAVSAMLVSCITDADPGGSHDKTQPSLQLTPSGGLTLSGRNPLLEQYCGAFMQNVVNAVPKLLAPQQGAPSAAKSTPAAKPAPKPAPAVDSARALQIILAADGDYQIPANGVDNPAAEAAALALYEQKHKLAP